MFVLVADGLNKMFVKVRKGGLLHGLLGNNAIMVINLQYIDDTLMFGCCDVGQACVIKCILAYFVKQFELQINFHNNSLMNLGRRNIVILFIQSIISCKVEVLSITYLEIPVRMGRLVKKDWNVNFYKLEKRLNGWKAKSLSLGGQLTLVNEVLLAMPTYLISYHSKGDS